MNGELTEKEARKITEISLEPRLRPKAEELVRENFCNDCEGREPGWTCFPCKSARTMIKVFLIAIVSEGAKGN